ncbi:MAG: sulfurtransferase [Actinomycetota bacterium]
MGRQDVLIGTDVLAGTLGEPGIRVIEVDEDTTLYEKGHIPGAVARNWRTELHDPVRREFIGERELEALLARSEVAEDTTVVLYGGNNNWFAAYAYWLLRYRGLDRVKLLNGGRKKWELESRELTTELPDLTPPERPAKLAGDRTELRALREEVIEAVGSGAKTFVDVRSPEEFRGELLLPRTCRRSRPRSRATSRVPPTSPGARLPPRMGASSPMRS